MWRRRFLRASLAASGSAAVIVATTGWLYVARPWFAGWPGPLVHDALPFDELARHGSVPLLGFILVWAIAAALIAALIRFAGSERLTAALLLALGVGAWTYLYSGAALLIVRQVAAEEAFADAAQLRAVYLSGAIVGLAGALGGRRHLSVRPRAPLVLAWFVAAAGALGVLDAVLPGEPTGVLLSFTPGHPHPVAKAFVGPLGLALLVVAHGLARRKRRAWQLALGLLGGLTVVHFLHGFGYGAVATALVALALVARRHDFGLRGAPGSQPRVLWRGASALGAIYVYAVVGLWVNRVMVDQPFSLGFAAREMFASLAGLRLGHSAHLSGDFAVWFPTSILVAGLASVGWLLLSWLAPWRYRQQQEGRERHLARDLVASWGVDTLSPFVLRADKSYYFSTDERAFLAYKVVGGVAIVSGDPIGPPDSYSDLLRRFIEFAHERDWRVAVLGASERCLAAYREQGLHALYHGDEAVIEVADFSLEGRAIRKVRQSVHRLERAGYRAEILHPRDIGPELRDELEEVERAWRGREPERGFVMALDALFRLEDDDAVFVIGRDTDGVPRGFLHFALCRSASALSLSSMPRMRETPNGFTEWLVCEAVAWARAQELERVSLNFAPFAALLAPEAELRPVQRVQRRALLSLKGHFQLDNLLLFNRKFLPSWERRFVVYERRRDLPRVGIAALAAEAYLPFTGRER